MKIQFESGEAGYHEAYELKRMVQYVLENTASGSHDLQVLSYLNDLASAHLDRPEFERLRKTEAEPVDDRKLLHRLSALWYALRGPGRREVELATQRGQALERAQRAEQSSFEALAETARVGRERDDALVRIKELEARVSELEAKR